MCIKVDFKIKDNVEIGTETARSKSLQKIKLVFFLSYCAGVVFFHIALVPKSKLISNTKPYKGQSSDEPCYIQHLDQYKY